MQTFQLYRGGELLGTLTPTSSDQPWLYGTFEPTHAFEELRPLYQLQLELLNAEKWDDWEAVIREIEQPGVKLVPIDGGDPVEEFLLNIDGEKAWWRY